MQHTFSPLSDRIIYQTYTIC